MTKFPDIASVYKKLDEVCDAMTVRQMRWKVEELENKVRFWRFGFFGLAAGLIVGAIVKAVIF